MDVCDIIQRELCYGFGVGFTDPGRITAHAIDDSKCVFISYIIADKNSMAAQKRLL